MSKKIAVIGDIMLDSYLSGKVSRVSPEAPVPVLTTDNNRRYVLGGCGNVANNIKSLDTDVSVFSFFSKSSFEGIVLTSLLKKEKIDFPTTLVSDRYQNILKERIIGNNQQIVRIDVNDCICPDAADEKKLISSFAKKIDEFSLVIISDYNKGVCSEYVCSSVIALCRQHEIPVIVDPKGNQWGKYRGAFIITPNMKEISDFASENIENINEAIEEKCRHFPDELEIENLLVTRSEKGMTLINDREVKHYPSLAREVYDVSGAGDTVVAALAVWLFHHPGEVEKAIAYANVAAGIVVGKAGTATTTNEEISKARTYSEGLFAPMFGVNELDIVKNMCDSWKEKGETVVTTNGCFDILHKGHVSLIHEAKKLGKHLVVCVNSDASVKRLKGEARPINSERDRAYLISALRDVDAVVIFDEMVQGTSNTDVPYAVLQAISPDIHTKGGDYSVDRVPEAKFAGKFVSIPFVEGFSTTGTLEKLKND